MTKLNTLSKGIFSLLLFFFSLAPGQKVQAQSCKQVEILYSEPDCFRKDEHQPNGSQGKGCKEIAACERQSYTYSATGSWATYNWVATGPMPVTITPSSSAPVVNIVWPSVGSYTLTLTVTDLAGNVFTYCLAVSVKAKPTAAFTFSPNNVCAGSTISFFDGSTFVGGIAYSWDFGDPASLANNISSAQNPTHQYDTPGTYTVQLITSSFVLVPGGGGTQGGDSASIRTCCSDTVTHTVTIKPGSVQIDCISTVCAGKTVTYTITGCASPTWLPPTGGTIVSSTSTQVTIQWGNGSVQGAINVQCAGGCTASVPVPIIPTNPVPVGNLLPCDNATTSYTLPILPGTFYTWSLNNITTGQTLILRSILCPITIRFGQLGRFARRRLPTHHQAGEQASLLQQ